MRVIAKTFDIDVILSLTRTTRVGYLRDIRRLTVALSRARLGLYILGRRVVFEACFELKEAFDRLLRRPDKLALATGEMYPTARLLDNETPSTEMEGVEHLGQYVYEMTQAKVAALKANGGVLPPLEEVARDVDMGEADEEGGDEDELEPKELEDVEDLE
jgi:intron-binding protein aquarius